MDQRESVNVTPTDDDGLSRTYTPHSSTVGRFPADPRAELVTTLSQSIATATEAGDLEGARILVDALARLLRPPPDLSGKVVELASERERRER